MRIIVAFILAISSTVICGCASQPNNEIKSFHVSIIRNPTFAPATQWHITPDSMAVSYTDFKTRQLMYYSRPWTEVEKQEVLTMISQWNLDSFEAVQIGDTPSDATSFSFDLQVDSVTYQKYTCMQKIEELFQFAAFLDRSLPEDLQVGYDDSYFKK